MLYKKNIKTKKCVCIDYNASNAKKKRGFTLIEVIAVIAIIGILAAVLLPKVSGYVKQAKKTKVVDQCRKVVMAVESYNLTSSTPIANTASVSSAIGNAGVSKYLDGVTLNNLDSSTTTLQKCYDIVGGTDFDIDSTTEKLITTTPNTNNTSSTQNGTQ
ncbi:prepilin-type N-terminal cleavage/methylation domain-containing protein [Clostridium sp.]|uniref:prepilin-type N-terminal cleavage/methylation domain-containing protein n=1 Tax=Clostridium sp. TaxID=1506 RepID=UPI00283BED5E|nr:prepilin-type N-terminal cleavage/methylation domain-containing protein [Clostridium sp.]MDR3596601.1 prepilin-type N-terminal cleavage/methylation domain-containing protein [Clostridium sp.]